MPYIFKRSIYFNLSIQNIFNMPKKRKRLSIESSAVSKINIPTIGRPKPMGVKAGVTKTRRRLENGGKKCK